MFEWYINNPLEPSDILAGLVALIVGAMLYRASNAAAVSSREAARATAQAAKMTETLYRNNRVIELREHYICLYNVLRGLLDFRAWVGLYKEDPALVADSGKIIENLPRNISPELMGVSDSAIASLTIAKCNQFSADARRMAEVMSKEEIKKIADLLLPQIDRVEELIEEAQKKVVNKLNPPR
ncbi:hypothetical protein DCCM_2684 [Desulfocucumis palustris]|uniref:Uncharacterized protein n=1 Tax=Desulfocucumis palustris TaxID=1898651 RepID=A0A2L2XI65_9FIRM|nr:hypothetical protein [Desulfocucumis palustris]GBF33581.1 hypothetical protein DCCM_2684 [Desulfocucumis palustris]